MVLSDGQVMTELLLDYYIVMTVNLTISETHCYQAPR